MANLSFWSFGWVGFGFNPGTKAGWWVGPIGFDEVVSVTPQPVGNVDRAMIVTNLETHIDGEGNRSVVVIVQNIGPNVINGYALNFSFVTP